MEQLLNIEIYIFLIVITREKKYSVDTHTHQIWKLFLCRDYFVENNASKSTEVGQLSMTMSIAWLVFLKLNKSVIFCNYFFPLCVGEAVCTLCPLVN